MVISKNYCCNFWYELTIGEHGLPGDIVQGERGEPGDRGAKGFAGFPGQPGKNIFHPNKIMIIILLKLFLFVSNLMHFYLNSLM